MSSKKQVRVRCDEPYARYPKFQQSWSDVYLSWKVRPGRKRVYHAPCLIAIPNLRWDLEVATRGANSNWHDDIEFREMWEEDVAFLNDVLNHFAQGTKYLVKIEDIEDRMPNIYVNSEYIDKKVAEDAIRHYMSTLGYNRISVRWQHPRGRGLFVIPAGAIYNDEEGDV